MKAVLASAALAALSAAAYEGPVFEVPAWKGEKAYAAIPGKFAGEMVPFDGAEESGVTLRLAHFRDTSYEETPGSPQLRRRRDILEPCEESGAVPSVAILEVPATAVSGEYRFGPLSVKVRDRVLPPPSEWRYFLDLWQHPWAAARYFGVEPFSPEHYEAMRPAWTALAGCGVKALTVTLLDMPWNHQCFDAYGSMVGRTKKDDGSWEFDYSVFDAYVEFGRSCGIGPDIACYTMCPWGYVVRWKDEHGATHSAEAKPGSEAFDEFWGPFLPDFAAHLEEKGWFADAYIAMDERSPEDVRFIAGYIRSKVPGFKIAMAGNRRPSEFDGIVLDNYSQYLAHITPEFIAEVPARREKGLKTTFYVCCGPDRPNTFFQSAPGEAFWLGVYPALSGLDGFLRWAANSWPAEPYDDASFGNWRAGDTFLVYPGGELSSRLVELRAGIVAAEKLRILSGEDGMAEKVAALAAKYPADKAMKGEIDFAAFRREAEALADGAER